MNENEHRTQDLLEAGLDHILQSPADQGTVEMIVRRPLENDREELDVCELSTTEGLVGDSWQGKPSSRTPDRSAHPDMQLNIMNARTIALIAGDRANWPAAGDQLYIDLDLRDENLPAGTRLAIGSAVIEVTAQPHTGCAKFKKRFGSDALTFVNSPAGRELHLRGINARVVTAGTVRRGDRARKL